MKRRPTNLTSRLHRRQLLAGVGWLALLLLVASAIADHRWLSGRAGSDWEVFDRQPAFVSRVIDGDTICVGSGRGETPVRLLGIDAPDLQAGEGSGPQHWAQRCAEYLRGRCLGKTVVLKLDVPQTRDRNGCLLAYIYLSDSDLLNLDIIRDGQAYADRRFKHTYRPQFEMVENEARKKKRGLWKDVTARQMPAWRREWLKTLPR